MQSPAPAPVSPGPQTAAGQIACTGPGAEGVQVAYQAAVNGRNALREQANTLASERLRIAERLRQNNAAPGPDQEGLEARIKAKDKQLADVEAKLADAEAAVAKTAAVPCVVARSPDFPTIPGTERDMMLGGLFMLLVLFPLSIGFARRLWRRGAAAVANIPRDLSDRLSRLEQSVESVAIEIERIGEGQRFMTNVLVDTVSERALGAGTMEALAIKPRDAAEQQLRK